MQSELLLVKARGMYSELVVLASLQISDRLPDCPLHFGEFQ